jgi:hypothetical protein
MSERAPDGPQSPTSFDHSAEPSHEHVLAGIRIANGIKSGTTNNFPVRG